MATITSSTFALDNIQADGTRRWTEIHTWDGGVPQTVIEHGPVPPGYDYQAAANANAARIMEHKALFEFSVKSQSLDPLALVFQTGAEFAARFWRELQELRRLADEGQLRAKIEFSRRIWWLYEHVQIGDFTSNDVRVTFNTAYNRNLNTPQWSAFVTTTLMPIRDRYQAMLDQADL